MTRVSEVVSEKTIEAFTSRIRSTRPHSEPSDTHSLLGFMRPAFYRLVAGRSFRSVHRKDRLQPDSVRTVLIIRADAIGDYAVTTPLLQWLSTALPQASVDMVCSPTTLPLAEADPRIRRTTAIAPSDPLVKNWMHIRRFVDSTHYDVVFAPSVHRITRTALYALAAGRAPRRLAVEQRRRNASYLEVFDHLIPHQYPLRHWCQSMAMAAPLAIASAVPADSRPRIHSRPTEAATITDDYVVVNISAAESKRRWPVQHAADTIKHILMLAPDVQVVVIAGPEDQHRALDLCGLVQSERCEHRSIQLVDLPEFLRMARAIVSPDTGVIHLACAVDTAVVGLYLEPYKVVEWGPHGVPFRALISPEQDRLAVISPLQIAQELGELLEQVGGLP